MLYFHLRSSNCPNVSWLISENGWPTKYCPKDATKVEANKVSLYQNRTDAMLTLDLTYFTNTKGAIVYFGQNINQGFTIIFMTPYYDNN